MVMFGRLDPPGARGLTIDHALSATATQYEANAADLVSKQDSSFANDGVFTISPFSSCSRTTTPDPADPAANPNSLLVLRLDLSSPV